MDALEFVVLFVDKKMAMRFGGTERRIQEGLSDK